MWQRNKGQEEVEILQNQFTAYISIAVQRRRNDYVQQTIRQQKAECLVEDIGAEQEYSEQEIFDELPLLMQLENDALLYALKEINERERYVFLSRVLDEKNFETLADELGLGYKGVAAIYYRAIQKIKKRMEEME